MSCEGRTKKGYNCPEVVYRCSFLIVVGSLEICPDRDGYGRSKITCMILLPSLKNRRSIISHSQRGSSYHFLGFSKSYAQKAYLNTFSLEERIYIFTTTYHTLHTLIHNHPIHIQGLSPHMSRFSKPPQNTIIHDFSKLLRPLRIHSILQR